MADQQAGSRSHTPTLAPILRRPLDEDHAPAVSSPLNPNPDAASRARPKAPQREQREKRETLKKREASGNTRANTPNPKTKQEKQSVASPMRYSIPEPKPSDYDPPKEGLFASHEPNPLCAPGGEELKKPIDHAWNKKGYRYTHCIADPYFRHKQYWRTSETKPYGPRMSFEDTDKWFHFDESATIIANEKGWRMGRGNVVAREGRYYYEVKILKGIPPDGPLPKKMTQSGEQVQQPHVRVGWSRREAVLDTPVGYDSYSYGIRDENCDAMHRSRANKIFRPLPKGTKSKFAKARPPHGKPAPVDYITDLHLCEGDVIGLEIQLPSLVLHRKVVEGIYNPAVDIGDGLDVGPAAKDPFNLDKPLDVIRDRIPIFYKGNYYFEQLDYTPTKAMDAYSERGPGPKINPSPNHDEPSLRTLPHSHIKVYKNGKEVGIAFEDIMAFLPPASAPSTQAGDRNGFDDGMVGYFPTVSLFNGGTAQVNFGPDFWCPPEEMTKQHEDTEMTGTGNPASSGRRLRAIGERYKEQIAEDIVWDIIDEVDFFSQDGGWEYKPEPEDNVAAGKATPKARGFQNADENIGVEVAKRY